MRIARATSSLATTARSLSTCATAPPSLSPRRSLRGSSGHFHHRDASSRLSDEFILGAALGEGAWGSVRRARRASDGKVFAVKTIVHQGTAAYKRAVENEIAAMVIVKGAAEPPRRTISPPSSPSCRGRSSVLHSSFSTGASSSHGAAVPALEAVFETESATHIVAELCDGGDVLDLVLDHGDEMLAGAEGERRAASITRQMLETLRACHAEGIVHLDLKPENLLLREPMTQSNDIRAASWFAASTSTASSSELPGVVLADFGMARAALTERREATLDASLWQIGTVGYSAPELTGGDGGAKRYSTASDVWSAGITAFVIATRRGAWNIREPESAAYLESTLDFSFPSPDDTDVDGYTSDGSNARARTTSGTTPDASVLTQALSDAGRFDRSSNQWKGLSEEARDFVETLVKVDAGERPCVGEALDHPWLRL